jgi:hypothetical protein
MIKVLWYLLQYSNYQTYYLLIINQLTTFLLHAYIFTYNNLIAPI